MQSKNDIDIFDNALLGHEPGATVAISIDTFFRALKDELDPSLQFRFMAFQYLGGT